MTNTILNLDRFKQPVVFEGLNFGTIYPTDIDGMIEYKNKAYVFFEVKYRGKDIPLGQRIALERLVVDTGKSKESIALVLDHEVSNASDGILVKDCTVRELYFSRERYWRQTKPRNLNAYEAIKQFFKTFT